MNKTKNMILTETTAKTVITFEPTNDGIMPKKATNGSSGYDLYSPIDYNLGIGETYVLDLNVAIHIPTPYIEAQVRPRSSMSKRKIDVALGTIDNDYKKSIKVCITNNSKNPYLITKGDRVAQLVFAYVVPIIAVEGKVYDNTKRGGFGSTGK